MQLTDLAPVEKWKELEEDIYKQTGLSANVFNTDGIRISDFHQWPNRLCPAVKATDAGQSSICATAHMNLAAMAKNARESVIEECDAGLVKLVAPIFAEDEFVGAVGACGLLLDDGEVDAFLVNKITGIDEDEVERLSEGIPAVSTERMEALKQYVEEKIAQMTGNSGKGGGA